MGKVRDFKLGVRIDRQTYKPKKAKVGKYGRGIRHLTYFCNFSTPTISVERLNVQTSNLVQSPYSR